VIDQLTTDRLQMMDGYWLYVFSQAYITADVSLDAARCDAVDADAVAGPLGGEAPSELVHGALGHGVDGERRHPDGSGDGGDVDHAAATATGEEERVRQLAEVEARFEVGRHDPRVVVAAALHGGLEQRLSRVVHLHVHASIHIKSAAARTPPLTTVS